MRLTVILSTLFFLISTCLSAQSGVIKGTIFDKDSGEPIIYGNVQLEGTTIGTNTNLDGFFTIAKIPVGKYSLMATYIGYDTVRAEIDIVEGIVSSQTFYMTSSGVNLGVVSISAAREVARTEVQVSKVQVSQKQIKALPSTGADADIVQYLQILPGVVSTGDQGGQLFIRGGSPVQNKILLDGLTIYNPFHSIGFYSVFETELIKNADVLTGGFGAEYGGRISAIVDIQTRDGNKKHVGGQVSASPFMVKALIEGPIKKFKEGNGSSSFIFTSKRSIIDKTSPTLYKNAAVNDSIGLPFTFNDTYGKVSFNSESGSSLSLFGFNFEDSYNNPLIADVNWQNTGGGANFTLVPPGSNMLINGVIGYTNYDIGISEEGADPRSSAIRELETQLHFTLFGDNSEVNYGFELRSIRTNFEFVNPFGLSLNQEQNTTEFSGFLSYRRVFNDLVIEPGVRVQYYASQSKASFEPRLGIKYNITDWLRFKGAAGMYTQNILSTSNERDVVNLFSGFLSGPESQVAAFGGGFTTDNLQKSTHYIGGLEIDLTDNILFNVEGYLKDFPQLIIVNRNKILASDPDYSSEEGEAYGIDFSLKYQKKRIYAWMTYSYGFVNRFDGEQTYPTVFDRRHNVNSLVTYDLDDTGDWSVSLRWNFGSGFPFTQTKAFYDYNNLGDGVSTDVVTANPDEIGIIYSDTRNGGRLPSFHRLDFSMTKKIKFSKYVNMELVASVSNLYDRENIFFFDRVEYDRVNQLPIIPSAGLKLNF